MLNLLEADPMRRKRQADDQGREEILKVSSKRPLFVRHAEKAGRRLVHLAERTVKVASGRS